jgi:hypothetical protein
MTTPFEKLLKRSDDAGISFITMEIDLALQLLNTASTVHDQARQNRLLQEARDAYDTALRCIPHLNFTETQEREIQHDLKEVRGRLEEATAPVTPKSGRYPKRSNRASLGR